MSTNGIGAGGLLAGKRIVVTGVVTRESIAYSAAELAQRQGAEVVLTSFGRAARLTERLARGLPVPTDVLELDVTREEHYEALRSQLEARWGRVDGLVHAIAHAPPDGLGGNFLDTPWESAASALEVSTYSFARLTKALEPLMDASPAGASVVGIDFDASVAWPDYDWMGVAKAGLESAARYMTKYLGRKGIRVNLVAAGPLRTLSSHGIPCFDVLSEQWRARAPLGWRPERPDVVAGPICFLLSDLAVAVGGEILHVDGGMHAVRAVGWEWGSGEPTAEPAPEALVES
ncbi:MAG: enoyl-ACP reductase FabI [Actinomycetota bacterium]|nr:enoyl-ACP reductase FabI [Actinomycetota bacterium]